MKTLVVGDFQHAVLNTIRQHPSEASVTQITGRVNGRFDRDVHNGEISRALKKLEMRGLVSRLPIETRERRGLGGRPRQFYELTELGHRVVNTPRVSATGDIIVGGYPA